MTDMLRGLARVNILVSFVGIQNTLQMYVLIKEMTISKNVSI